MLGLYIFASCLFITTFHVHIRNTVTGANNLCRHLERAGIKAQPIHGNKSQQQREKTLNAFRSGALSILVATDIAARGIDIDDVTHVFNFDLPNVPEIYIHRIGRTARAGKRGHALSFCDASERRLLREIEKLMGVQVPVASPKLIQAGQAIRGTVSDRKTGSPIAPGPSRAPETKGKNSARYGKRGKRSSSRDVMAAIPGEIDAKTHRRRRKHKAAPKSLLKPDAHRPQLGGGAIAV